MVYDLLLRFEKVRIGYYIRRDLIEPRNDGIMLQHNPEKNFLAIMVTNRQLYHETRSVFYGTNTFTFISIQNMAIFLMGIGPSNAMLFKRLMCETPFLPNGNLAPDVQSCVVRRTTSKGASKHAEDAELTWDLKLLAVKL